MLSIFYSAVIDLVPEVKNADRAPNSIARAMNPLNFVNNFSVEVSALN